MTEHEHSLVYFVEAIGADLIKIGVTTDLRRRLLRLQTGFPYKLKLLKTLPGDVLYERTIHRLFRSHRVRGEWFHAEPIRHLKKEPLQSSQRGGQVTDTSTT